MDVRELVQTEIRDKIWRQVLERVIYSGDGKMEEEIRELLEQFRAVRGTENSATLSRFLWSMKNEISLLFRATWTSKFISRALSTVCNRNRILGFYLASWTRVYGRHALVQGIKESLERIDLDIDKLTEFSEDPLFVVYFYSKDSEFAEKEVRRICGLTEEHLACDNLIKTLSKKSATKARRVRALEEKTKEYILGLFFSIHNTAMYIMHERLVDPHLSHLESFLPRELNSPAKILDYMDGRPGEKQKIERYFKAYLEVLP